MTEIPSPEPEDSRLAFALVSALAFGCEDDVLAQLVKDVAETPGAILHLAGLCHATIKAIALERGVPLEAALSQVGSVLGEDR